MRKIIIVGGGFGGIKTALELERQHLPDTKIALIHNKFHFEYHGALYRTVTGRSPLEVCIPLQEIFQGKDVEVIEDEIVEIKLMQESGSGEGFLSHKILGASGSTYECDHLVLALGMQTNYFNIPGLQEYSFGFKTIDDALRLKEHLHEVFERYSQADPEEQKSACHIVVVGAGASGVEAAGDLFGYAKELASKHGMDPSMVSIDLIEAKDRILPLMPEAFSTRMKKQLEVLGVSVHTDRRVVKEDIEGVYLEDMKMKTKTVIWTAGVKAHELYGQLELDDYDAQGRVVVDKWFQPKGKEAVYVIGDGASTKESGMAQSALMHAQHVARIIAMRMRHKNEDRIIQYNVRPIIYPIPVGPMWAGVLWGKRMFFGKIGWFLRRYFDFKVFRIFLPFHKAVQAFREGGVVCETCERCRDERSSGHSLL